MNVEAVRNKLIIGGLVACGLLGFWFQRAKNAPVEAREGGPQWSPANAKVHQDRLEAAMRETLAALKSDRLREAARVLGRAYPAFDSFSAEHGFKATAEGPTLREWFEGRRARFNGELMAAWPGVREKLARGDVAWEDYRAFETSLPFPFSQELRQAMRAARPGIEAERAAAAPGWFMVQGATTTTETAGYAASVRAALERNWNKPAGLKLVLDQPMGGAESAAVARLLRVEFREEHASNEFEGKAKRHGSGRVPRALTVTFTDATRRKEAAPAGAPAWDRLPPIAVQIELPEKLSFKFERERQQADFDDFTAKKRTELDAELRKALAAALPAR